MVQGIGWFALFHLLLAEWLSYTAVLVLVYAVAIPIGFVLYRTLVFQVTGQWLPDFARFTLVQAVAFLINLGSLSFIHEVLGLPILVSQVLAIGVVLFFSYAGHLYFSFRRGTGHPEAGLLMEPHGVVSPVSWTENAG